MGYLRICLVFLSFSETPEGAGDGTVQLALRRLSCTFTLFFRARPLPTSSPLARTRGERNELLARLQNACPSVGRTRRRVRDMNHIKAHAAPIHSIRGRPTNYGVCQCKISDPARSSPCSRSDSSPRLTTCHWGSSYERHKLSAADHATSHGPPPGRSARETFVQRPKLQTDRNLQWQGGNVGTN